MKTTRITEMFAFVAIDPADNTEGVIASKLYDGGWMPLVGADMDRIESLRVLARSIAHETGRQVRLLRFTCREELPL